MFHQYHVQPPRSPTTMSNQDPASALLPHRSRSQARLPPPGWMPQCTPPNPPGNASPTNAATATKAAAGEIRSEELNQLCIHHETSVGPLQKSVCPPTPTTCNEGTQVKENGRPAAKSVCPPTPNSMKWNTRPMMPSSVGCEHPQAPKRRSSSF